MYKGASKKVLTYKNYLANQILDVHLIIKNIYSKF